MALSTKQKAAIELILANPTKPESKVIEEMGLTNRTFYNWKKDAEFMGELSARLKEQWKSSERKAINTMIKLCEEGNFQAAKYILDSNGWGAPVEVNANVNGSMDINITIEE